MTYLELLQNAHEMASPLTWEILADEGIVDPASIGGDMDVRWLIGDDVIADAERRICEMCGYSRIDTDSDGLVLSHD